MKMNFEEAMSRAKEYFGGDDLAASVFISKYAITDDEGNYLEGTPEEMHMRMAKEYARIEEKMGGENKLSQEEIFNLFKDWTIIPGGSVMNGLGNPNYIGSLSNCFVAPPPQDSYSSIMKNREILVQLMKRRGGVGIDISNLRPKQALVNYAAKTTSGAVSFMTSFDTVTKVIGQNGRRGALMISIDINHPDVPEFIDIKTDLEKVTSANISVRVSDEFMRAVENDEDYILRFPCDLKIDLEKDVIENLKYNELTILKNYSENTNDFKYVKKVRAKELFDRLCENNWNYAEPGILYWDRIANYNLLSEDKEFEYAGVNPCAEEPLPAGGSCLLGSLNLSEFVKDGKFDFSDFKKAVEVAVIALNDVLDEGLPLHPLQIQRDSVSKYRQIGLGIFGYADMLIKLKMRYGTLLANDFTEEVGSTLITSAIETSAKLAKERGAYDAYTPEVMNSEFFKRHIDENSDVYNLVKTYGLRNSQLLTIAPTGTLSTMLNVSGGAEPIFAKSYTRTTKSLHDKDVTYTVYPKVIQEYLETSGKTIETCDDYIVSSENITPEERVKVQGVWQKYIDASISSTVNLPKETTVDDVRTIYMNAWKNKLKGVTVFRAGCARIAILQDTKTVNKEPIDKKRGYVKRPKEITADYHQVKIKGETFIVLVGFVNDKPYEIFAYRPNVAAKIPNHQGKIIKVKKNHYSFKSDLIEIPNLQLITDNVEEKAATLYTSMLLRHNTNIKYVIKTAKKVNDNISSFSSAMCRILSKYMPSEDTGDKCPDCGGNIVRENGCLHCDSCGWSKCE
jgi:ribonucleoside-diphosphate reductase alpha chain